MTSRRLPAALLLATSAVVLADARPAWLDLAPAFLTEPAGARAFVAVGRSGETGPADFRGEEAENAARQAMGGLVANWQDRTLACAGRARGSEVRARTNAGTGATLSLELETVSSVSFYRDRVVERAYEGRRIVVLLRHELASMIAGIRADPDRPAALRQAVASCGNEAFDGLARKE